MEDVIQVAHSGNIRGVSTSVWNPYAVTAGSDRSLLLWNVSTGKIQFSIRVDEDILGVSVHPIGNSHFNYFSSYVVLDFNIENGPHSFYVLRH